MHDYSFEFKLNSFWGHYLGIFKREARLVNTAQFPMSTRHHRAVSLSNLSQAPEAQPREKSLPPISHDLTQRPHPFEQILHDLLEPLTPDSFQTAIGQVQDKLTFLNQILALLEHNESDEILFKMLQTITLKVGELLRADRTTIFLLDEGQQELWSVLAQENAEQTITIRIPTDQGIAGYVAQSGATVNIPVDFYDDPRSATAKILDQDTGYRTYSLLTMPLISPEGRTCAVVQLLNKYQPGTSIDSPLSERIHPWGFSKDDEVLLASFSDAILLLLESSQAVYQASQKQRASDALIRATQYLCETDLDWESTLTRVLEEARNLMFAEYSDIWLIASDRQSLYRPLGNQQPHGGQSSQTLSCPMSSPIIGKVAQSGQGIRLNGLRKEAEFNSELGINSPIHNLLCLPLWNQGQDIIGVTLLVNKSPHHFDEDNVSHAEQQGTQSNFGPEDESFMVVFNRHAGLALERAQRFQYMEAQIQKRTVELEEKHQILHQEILERKKVEVQLQQLNLRLEEVASMDALTQIYNRREFDTQFQKEWKRMAREHQPLSLVMGDVDFFKRYNDTYGHPAGDRCLYQVAQAIKSTVNRPADIVARYGGEEFVVLLPNTHPQGALYLATKMLAAVEELQIEHRESSDYRVVTMSLGVASMIPGSQGEANQLLKNADDALYQAKQRGRNQVFLNE